ncbi:MAG TPA: tetratricopeptide repeat protein [Kofleriaceae bacterium]|nr:tetratricopeptide repeat protein [Kofleriaceae bacterium]
MSFWSRIERRLGDLADDLLLDDYRDQVTQARALVDAGDPYAAIDVIEALLRDKPEHGHALIVLGAARLATHEPARAKDAFERALRSRGGDPSALCGLGEALYETGAYEESISVLGRAVQEAAGDRSLLAEAYRTLGLAWRQLGDVDKAIRELRKAVAEAPGDAEARAALGEAMLEDNADPDEARKHLDKAVEADPPPAVAFLALGRLSLADQVPALAAQHFARALALVESDQSPPGRRIALAAACGLGDAALGSRDPAGALAHYLAALAIDPRRAETHAKLAEAHRAIGNYHASLDSFDRALQTVRPERSAEGAESKGAILSRALDTALSAGDTTRANRYAHDLLALVPDHPRALVALALARLDAGQPDAARSFLAPALNAASPDPEAHLALARVELAHGDPDAAARAAKAALRVDPHHDRARAILVEARAKAFGADIPADADIRQVATVLERIAPSSVGDIARATADLDQPLLVTVMGEFSSGKSSFVNAFIGADIAPTGITPTTATINVVRFGAEQGGRIVTRDGAVLTLAWDALFTHLRALTPDAARAIDRVEILLPLPSLEKIAIVDTPGLNSILPEHEQTARAFIARADAVVWVFTAGQGGKKSERAALEKIKAEGRRVLGVLNKRDQLSESDEREVIAYITQSLGELIEGVVPFSARKALAHKTAGENDDGNWSALVAALEDRFFSHARQLKRAACARRLSDVVARARTAIDSDRIAASHAAELARDAAAQLDRAAAELATKSVDAERRAFAEATTSLYRRAAREVLDLVQPRRLPFQSNSATPADRDYLIALLDAGYESALEAGRRRVTTALTTATAGAYAAAAALTPALGAEVASDVARVVADRTRLVLAQVFDRARAYLRGYLVGGFVERFFTEDLPRVALAEDAVFHALLRNGPDLDREIATPLARAGAAAISDISRRLAHWAGVADVAAFDLDTGVARALDTVAAHLR